mmetsp:Transcript_21587/g.69797  ORF Transcript_21587/g.69797 Transcript_21587/m.69797 type:complete len:448 (+) Transcript_21587:2234-3577(+)
MRSSCAFMSAWRAESYERQRVKGLVMRDATCGLIPSSFRIMSARKAYPDPSDLWKLTSDDANPPISAYTLFGFSNTNAGCSVSSSTLSRFPGRLLVLWQESHLFMVSGSASHCDANSASALVRSSQSQSESAPSAASWSVMLSAARKRARQSAACAGRSSAERSVNAAFLSDRAARAAGSREYASAVFSASALVSSVSSPSASARRTKLRTSYTATGSASSTSSISSPAPGSARARAMKDLSASGSKAPTRTDLKASMSAGSMTRASPFALSAMSLSMRLRASVWPASQRLKGSESFASRKTSSSDVRSVESWTGAENPRRMEGTGLSSMPVKVKVASAVSMRRTRVVSVPGSASLSSVSGRSAPSEPSRPTLMGSSIAGLSGCPGVGLVTCEQVSVNVLAAASYAVLTLSCGVPACSYQRAKAEMSVSFASAIAARKSSHSTAHPS